MSRSVLWVVWSAWLGFFPAMAGATESGAADSSEAALESWLSREPGNVDASASDPALEAPPLPPRRHGWVVEGSVGALGHLGNMRDVSPVAPWFRLQVGFEPFDWLMPFVQGDVALASTALAHRPPEKRAYSLFGVGGGCRLSWQAFPAIGLYLQGDAGFASVDQDVLATYGYPDADRLRPYAGGALGVEWFQLSPHYALALSGGTRDYFRSFDRINGSRPPWVWFSSVAIRYAL